MCECIPLSHLVILFPALPPLLYTMMPHQIDEASYAFPPYQALDWWESSVKADVGEEYYLNSVLDSIKVC